MMLEAMLFNDFNLIGQLRDIRHTWLKRVDDMSNTVIIMSDITYRAIVREVSDYTILKETRYEPKNILGFKIEIDNRLEPFRIRIEDRERKAYRTNRIDYGDVADMWTELDKYERRIDMSLPKRTIYSNKTTILMWEDNTKTIVKCSKNDKFNPINGFLYAYFEKNSGLTKTQARKYLEKVEETYKKQIEKQ